tara:strand:- start:1787 stop:2800 length:1014 start_codon:yes stop_codon:yes gene_type:complete
MSIQTKIDKVIRSFGSINIQDFVEISNFDEEGFYNLIETEKISKSGHFITTPEISSLFGYSICNQFLKNFPVTQLVHLIELGPGNGTLTSDILDFLKQKKIEVSQISLLEKSHFFQKKIIEKKYPKKVNFIKNISDLEFSDNEILFIYSNEFFDAIGSKQFIYKDRSFFEIKIKKEKNDYKLFHEPSLLSNYLEEQYLSNEFQDGDILEHSTLLVNLYEELNSILKKKFFFSATDYGYLEIPRKSTLRLVSKHTKVNLFEKFENVDYSFGVNFGLFSNFFKNFFPLVISQHELINNFIPFEYKISKDKNIMKTIEMISGDGFYKMGKTFFNISFFQK